MTIPPTITLNAEKAIKLLFIFCIVFELLLVVFDITINFAQGSDHLLIQRMFNVAREDSIASWFGTTQTFLTGLTLLFIYLIVREKPELSLKPAGWLIIALFFIYLAIDDGIQLHERIGSYIHTTIGGRNNPVSDFELLNIFPSFTWQVIFLPLFVFAGIYILYFLWRELKTKQQRITLLICFSLLGTAVVLDFFEGLEQNHALNLHSWLAGSLAIDAYSMETFNRDAFTTIRHFSRVLEELFEMMAFTLFWVLFLRHLIQTAPAIRINLRQ